MASAFTFMAGFAITAVAVAPMMPDAAALPQRLVIEEVLPDGMHAQLAALAAQDLSFARGTVTRATDTPAALLARLGVQDASAADFLRSNAVGRLVLSGRGGKSIQADTASDGRLSQLVARFAAQRDEQVRTHFTRLTMARADAGWTARLETVPFETRTRMAGGTIRSSLFAATDEANLPEAIGAQLAEIFATDVDFQRELRKGDTFSVIYETLLADGEPVTWGDGIGRVEAAEFVNNGKAHHAIWFAPNGVRGAYFDIDGGSKTHSFLSSPLAFSRVTSGFAMRLHPLLKSWRQHLGVDYAAPTGTDVRVVGDGVVEFAGQQNGYGNVVKIEHANNRSTLYAHLSRIDVRKGQRVEQGQSVGAVGQTGWATGPHLHFEFMVGDKHEDPQLIAKSSQAVPLDAGSRPRFNQLVSNLQLTLDVAQTLGGRHALAE